MRVFVVGSGSSGNSILVETRTTRLVVDAGIGPKAMARRLRALDWRTPPLRAGARDVDGLHLDGIVPTHEHVDHFGRAEMLARATGAPVYLHDGVEAERLRARHEVRRLAIGHDLVVGDVAITSVAVPHDAPNVALRVEHHGVSVAIATDLGHVTPAVLELLASADVVVLEANHCPRMLAAGPYPGALKRRVAGDAGHLSNEQAAAALADLRGARPLRAYLVHLSQVNNSVEQAHAVVRSRARAIPVVAIDHGAPYELDLSTPRRRRDVVYGQLALPFG